MEKVARDYCKAQAEAEALLEEIKKALTERAMQHAHNGGPLRTHYGYVGDIAAVASDLRQIADRLIGRGEYA